MSLRLVMTVTATICTLAASTSMAQDATDEGQDAFVPIRPRPPYRLWYQPQLGTIHPELYPHISFVNSINSLEEARFWNERGVAVGRWAYGQMRRMNRTICCCSNRTSGVVCRRT